MLISGKPNPGAIVLGTELPRATAVVQSLGRRGVPVTVFDHRVGLPASKSRYVTRNCSERHSYRGESEKVGNDSHWHYSSEQALERLLSIGPEGGLLIPTNDSYLLLCSQNHAVLSEQFVLCTPPWKLLERVMDKSRMYALATQGGIDVPQYHCPCSLSEGLDILQTLEWSERSYIFKLEPWVQGPADPASGAMTMLVSGSVDQARESFRDIHARTGALAMIQEVIPGAASDCIGVSLVSNKDSELVGAVAMQRRLLQSYGTSPDMVHSYDRGANVFAHTIDDAEAINFARQFARLVGYYGPATLEFRRSQVDGRLKLIKLDPRFVNATALTTASGCDLPWICYQAFCTQESPANPVARPGVCWVWGDRWIRIAFSNLFSRQFKFSEIFSGLGKTRALAYFQWNDPFPFLRALMIELWFFCKRLWKNAVKTGLNSRGLSR